MATSALISRFICNFEKLSKNSILYTKNYKAWQHKLKETACTCTSDEIRVVVFCKGKKYLQVLLTFL
jgi:hypothetical protein